MLIRIPRFLRIASLLAALSYGPRSHALTVKPGTTWRKTTATPRAITPSSTRNNYNNNHNNKPWEHPSASQSSSSSSLTFPSSFLSRHEFGRWCVSSASSFVATSGAVCVVGTTMPRPALAFEGGVGGLGKTKPTTGVQFFDTTGYSAPLQNPQGIVTAEIKSLDPTSDRPILVQFQTPWPLLPTTSGLEARDLQSSESAFIQVVPAIPGWSNDRKVFLKLLEETVLASQGKYGAYGTPTDVKLKPRRIIGDDGTISTTSSSLTAGFSVTFTSYTPGMRESERQVWILPRQVDKDTLVLLIVGTTRARFSSQEGTVQKIADSFQATAAPQSKLR
jgi:hypothetical protein